MRLASAVLSGNSAAKTRPNVVAATAMSTHAIMLHRRGEAQNGPADWPSWRSATGGAWLMSPPDLDRLPSGTVRAGQGRAHASPARRPDHLVTDLRTLR